jgi:hypothetical protein
MRGRLWGALWGRVPLPVLVVVFPGLFAHEATHAIVARPFAERVAVDWSEMAVTLSWADGRRWPRVLVLLAPLGVGYGVAVGVVAAVVVAEVAVPLVVIGVGAAQWLFYVGGAALDVRAALAV